MSSLPGAVIAHLYIRKKRKNVKESFFPSLGKNRDGKAQLFIDCCLLTIDDALSSMAKSHLRRKLLVESPGAQLKGHFCSKNINPL